MKRHKTLRESLAIIYNIISVDGEISEYELIKKLEFKGISHWSFNKIKKYIVLEYPDVKISKGGMYYIGSLDSSLSLLSPQEKEKLK